MARIAFIGGTGAGSVVPAGAGERIVPTPWGGSSAPLRTFTRQGHEIFFLPRHGDPASIPPHRVNYRANVWALASLRPDFVVGLNAVGGIAPELRPGRLAVPDQLIDYTWGREQTYHDGSPGTELRHVEFDPPFAAAVRARLLGAATRCGLDVAAGGTYGVTQGPRFETAAEIGRMAGDGCHMVGMTALPEAALARELGLDYAILALVSNAAAGRLPADHSIGQEIPAALAEGARAMQLLLDALFRIT